MTTGAPPPPADAEHRERIRTSLDETLFVGAGAGTGKTTALVARVMQLVETGRLADMSQLVAITFTENAAAELRERIRAALTASEHDACRRALRDLDDAAITTVHGFAARLLTDHPIEAGLLPGFAVSEGVSAQLRSRQAWETSLDELLDDPALADHVLAGLALGLKLPVLREVAEGLAQSWDQLDAASWRRRLLPVVSSAVVVAPLRRAVALGRGGPEGDKLTTLLAGLEVTADELAAQTDRFAVLELLAGLPLDGVHGHGPGSAGAWKAAQLSKAAVIAELQAADQARQRLVGDVGLAVTETLGAHVVAHVLAEAERRREAGALDFHDLLVLARDLLRDDDGVRQRVHERLPVVMVDEFQDTDPLQAELVHLIAGSPSAAAAATPVPWEQLPVEGGRLFFVGDPKQSIYRFRRADVALYRRVGEVHAEGHTPLSVNFRSVPGVLAAVNHVFTGLMANDPHQVEHADLVAARPDSGSAAVRLLGGPLDAPMAAIREAEASDVAAAIVTAHSERWPVTDPDAEGGTRAPRFSDVAVLVPTRTSLSALEDALQRAGVPYRIESRSLVWGTDAVRDVVTLLQAVDDPGDEVAVVAALRHPGLACSDVDLTGWAADGGRWNYLAPVPEGVDAEHPVAAGMAVLRGLHELRWWVPVHELVARVVRELRLVELTAPLPRPRDAWRRLRFVVDQARAFEDAGGAGLGAFVAWAGEQVESDANVLETVVPEPDDDAVRILTVHGSKGLEFPITVVAGMGGGALAPRNLLWHRGAPQLRLKAGLLQTAGWDDAAAEEKLLDAAEGIRLLYVAMTRAQDHLVLACHHKPPKGRDAVRSRAQRVWEALSARPDLASVLSCDGAGPVTAVVERPWGSLPERTAMAQAREELLAGVRARVATSPTALVAEHAVDAADPAVAVDTGHEPLRDDEAPDADASDAATDDDSRPSSAASPSPTVRRAGQQGRAIGTAVHWVLEHVDVAAPTREEVRLLAVAACRAAGLPGLVDDVARRCWTALADTQLRAAAAEGRLLREVYVVAQDGGRYVEGYVDALVTGGAGEGVTVVDHKTDRVRSEADREERRAHYAPQLEAYRRVLEAAGVPVEDTRLLFASPAPGRAAASATMKEEADGQHDRLARLEP